MKIKLKVAIYEKINISHLVGYKGNKSDFKIKFVVLVGFDPLTEEASGNFSMGEFATYELACRVAKNYAEENGYKLLLNHGFACF